MTEQITIFAAQALRLLPWLGAILGLALIVVGETVKPELRYVSHGRLRTVGIGLTGVSIGALASGF